MATWGGLALGRMREFSELGAEMWLSGRFRVLFAVWLAWLIATEARGGEPVVKRGPTFSKDVAPILQNRCMKCHRPRHVAPFPLVTYEQARKRAADIANVAEER